MNWFVCGLFLGAWLTVCRFSIAEGRRVYDLTHTLDSDAPKYPVRAFDSNMPDFEYFKSTSLYADYHTEEMWLVVFILTYTLHSVTVK